MKKYTTKILLFLSLFVLAYLGIAFLLGIIPVSDRSFILYYTNAGIIGGPGQTLRRFRDIQTFSDIDILFIGSSHCYRSFDPRIFLKRGYTSFNMGSLAQTPINTYYLLKRYFTRLNPDLVVFEVYFEMFSKDGLESFFDLAKNTSCSMEMVEMAVAMRHPYALNIATSVCLSRLVFPLTGWEQKNITGEQYIHGGYCESEAIADKQNFDKKGGRTITFSKRQIKYFKKIIRYIKKYDKKILLVVQPLPKEYIDSYSNYRESSETMKGIAEELQVEYIDFNNSLVFDTKMDYKDTHHLNANGVKKFNRELISIIEDKRFIEKQDTPLRVAPVSPLSN